MQSLAQKKARENFKKAIEYRKKTGCSLKQAFAHIKSKSTDTKKKTTPKKVAGYVKTIKKGGKTEVLYTNAKNAAKVKKYSKALKLVPGSAKQKSLFGVKKKSAKKPSENMYNINEKKKAMEYIIAMEVDLNNAISRLEKYKNHSLEKGGDYNFRNITSKKLMIKRVTSEIKARKKGMAEQYKILKSI